MPLTLDVEIDEECCGSFPVKGIEFDATVLHLGMNDFPRLSAELSPAELLVFQNMFICWLRESFAGSRFSVVEKPLGSSFLLLFSARFGSADPFVDALRTARWLGENDTLKFSPTIGIASGTVIAGFAGWPGDGSASVYGAPVFLASVCAKLNPKVDAAATITFPADEWKGRSFDEVFPPVEYEHPEKGRMRQPPTWKLGEPCEVDFPGTGRLLLRDIANFIHWMPSVSASDKAREWVSLIRSKGLYRKNR
ncbi:MAG: adenylate/guanylate cyclase domain-containing protein [Chlorobiaceae bacterium]|nr:adenylate/guanylate cyclase domain-containing protein [Chlorobiaceae bacterium]NTV61746.1 adenylate/guanylate cyclase domain-containing protein [Chlorobiaceae bacterium]